MKHIIAAAVMGLLLTPGLAWAGDEGGSEATITCSAGFVFINGVCFARTVPGAGSDNAEVAVMNPAVISNSTSSSAGGLTVPLILLLLVIAAVTTN
jgi:hypothetical protein